MPSVTRKHCNSYSFSHSSAACRFIKRKFQNKNKNPSVSSANETSRINEQKMQTLPVVEEVFRTFTSVNVAISY